jgi:hypothetical protein
MGLTNEQWEGLYKQAIEKQKAAVRELTALENTIAESLEELKQAANWSGNLRDSGDCWTQEQVTDCGAVILRHVAAAEQLLRSAQRPAINLDGASI